MFGGSTPILTWKASGGTGGRYAAPGWAKRAAAWAKGGTPADLDLIDADKKAKAAPRDVFVYFIHEAKVRAPAAAMALIERVGK